MGIGQAIHKKEYQRCAFWSVLAFGASVLPLQSVLAQVADNALPQNGNVVGGSASFDYQDNQLDVYQNTDRVVIDWDGFHIGSAAGVEFFQPGSASIAVNRVIQGVDPTQILGSLKANGTVMILDPNGVVFGQDSRVDVGGIVATTGSIDTNSFMGGSDILDIFNVDTAGVVELRGFISVADAGLAAFVAPTVKNSGVIHARMGRVALASGDAATLDLYGDGLIEIAADDELAGALIDNSGTITAEGGVVQLSVSMAQSAVDNLINMDGMIDVSSVTQNGGQIILEGGNALVSGTLNADGKTGGGEILVGGDFQGKGDTLTAKNTLVTAEALLSANATNHGDGGKIIIWADQNTGFAGTIEATGGADGGDGGFVEVSGKDYLDFRGDVDLSGDNLGELLLDPDDIDIVAGVANPGEFADDLVAFAENGGGTSVLGADTLSGRLSANANVTLQANNTIDVDAAITSTGSGDLTLETAVGGTITVNQAIDVNTGDLTLIGDEIDINAALSGSGDIQLTSADVTQEIEIGATDTTDLNLTAAELANLQDGWNQITIGDNSQEARIHVNEAISMSDHFAIRNRTQGAGTGGIDINAAITTTDSSDLTLVGRAGAGSVHIQTGVHSIADINVARDLVIDSSPATIFSTSEVNVGRDYIGDTGPNIQLDTDMTVGRNFSQSFNGQNIRLYAGRTLDVGGDLTFTSGPSPNSVIDMQANSSIEADGDITFTSQQISFNSTASISGNADGSSNITFLETNGDEAMEIGGTSAGHNWQMEASEIDVIQDGFNSITFGSNTYTEAIDITGAVSFSDDVSFFNTGNDATITVQGTFATTDGANATFESGSAANVGWDAVNIDADMNIAGDLITRVGSGSGSGHVQIDNTNITVGGDWTLLSDNNGVINTTNIIVGGDLIAERGGSGLAPYTFNSTTTNITGDLIIDAGRNVRLFGDFTVGGNVDIENDSIGYDIIINDILSSSGTIDLTSVDNIIVTGDLTSNGNITLNSDRNADQEGAISITGSTINTNGGDFVAGGGANPLTTAAHAGQDGVYDIGVLITGGSDINAGIGDILIRGEGEDTGTRNEGVRVESNSTLTTTSGDISIYGQGGNGTDLNRGIMINDTNTLITTTSGNILIDGVGGNGSSSDNYGIQVAGGAEITSTGMGASVGTITLDGTGGDGTSDNYGVHLLDDTTQITSVDGAISLDGTGGRAATGADNHGVYFHDGADILSTGTTANAATISLTGLAGDGTSEGVYIQGGTVVSGYGDITITGTDDAISGARGVFISNFDTAATETKIRSTGIGNNAADITINGTSDSNDGVFLHVNAGVETQDGDVDINATGRRGAYLRFTSYIESFGTGANAGRITINGTGINNSGNSNGIELAQSSFIRSIDGDVNIMGHGGDTTAGISHGIVVGENNNSRIISNGSADITLDGTAGDCTLGSCYGVYFPDATTNENYISTTSTGNINITGHGGNIASDNYGIFLEGGAYIESTMAGVGAGTIALNGTGGDGTDNNHGISLDDSIITSRYGDIELAGVAGTDGSPTSSGNVGIKIIGQNGLISSTGNGANAANIALSGTGGDGDDQNYGVQMQRADITVVDGDVSVTGVGGSNGSLGSNDNYGVWLINNSFIESLGAGSDAGSISIHGTGGDGEDRNYGVSLRQDSKKLQTINGNITVTGVGGSRGGSGSNENHGVFLSDTGSARIESTGLASINLNGTSGNGDSDNRGVYISTGTSVINLNGDINVTGVGQGSGTNNNDVEVDAATIQTTGASSDLLLISNSLELINAANIDTQDILTIRNRTAGTSIGLGGGAGDLNIDDAELAQLTVGGKLTIGSTNAGLVTIDSVDLTAGAYATDIIGRNIVVENGLDVGNAVYLRSTQGDIRLNSGTVRAAGGGSSLVLNAARDFVNNAGPAALDAGIGGRFLVYASDLETSLRGDIMASVIEGETFTSLPPASVPAGDRFIFARNPFTEITSDITAQIQNFVAKDVNTEVRQDKPVNTPHGKDESLLLETEDDQTLIMDGVSCDSFGSNASSCVLN